MTQPEPRDADVVVVGAGLSGLAAARKLAAAGSSAIVLEARDRVGGRVDRGIDVNGAVLDLGAAWIGPTQTRMTALADELGVEVVAQYDDGYNLVELDGRIRRYKGTIPRVGLAALIDLARLQFNAGRIAKRISSSDPWAAAKADEFDSMTLDQWLRRHRHGRRARTLLGIAGKTIWGAEPGELSALFVAQYITGAGGTDALFDTEGGAQHERLVGGALSIAEGIAEELGSQVVLNASVEKIATDGDHVVVSGSTATVRARHAIVALPPPLCESIEFDPFLPSKRSQLQRSLRMGALTKCFAIYDEPFWRANGLSGEALSDSALASLTFDVSPPDGSCGVLLGFVGGDDARTFAKIGETEGRSAVLDGFARLFGERARSPAGWKHREWANERWSGGGPVAIAPPGALTSCGVALRDRVGRVLWAGTETAESWSGYMEGAVVAGRRAAAEALALS